MDYLKRSKWLGERIQELAQIIADALEEGDLDTAGFHLVDLQEFANELDEIIMKNI
ncbi:hypothetical protein [Geobacillus subterraneus]|uniref:Uncharacterized protein n=1 Tax=Geobacillus subterraneus TaxID=129338 RepID=A0A679FZB7_9BACL|nr:hypothetical protein [Geobacillus subterraneus]BBW99036.1 hypothetical protein GsuE55_38690 [Geobacillus subterraneus]